MQRNLLLAFFCGPFLVVFSVPFWARREGLAEENRHKGQGQKGSHLGCGKLLRRWGETLEEINREIRLKLEAVRWKQRISVACTYTEQHIQGGPEITQHDFPLTPKKPSKLRPSINQMIVFKW